MRKNKLKKNSFLQGTLIASFSLIFIKVLGALYVIPFYKIIGEGGGTLYSYAYNIYSLFLNVSTAGIPIAMSMIISEYMALEMYDAKERSKKVGTKMICFLAILSFCIVFFGSDILARFLLSDVTGGHSVGEVSLVIKAISFCLVIIPFLSILRGYLQGHKFISPTSFSQVLEQVVRIIVVLLGSYIAIKILGLSTATGVSVALTGAFFGGLLAYIYLIVKVNNNKESFPKSDKKDSVKNSTLAKKILSYSLPIVMVAIIDNLYTLVDIKLIVKGLSLVGFTALDAQTISGIVATWAPKICTIIIAIATALTTNIIPHVTTCFIKKDYNGVIYRVNQALSTMLIITVPMSILLFLLSNEAYSIFYGYSKFGGLILKYSAISHIFFGLWSVLNTSLQSMKKFKLIYLNSGIGLASNAILDIPLIILFNKIGLPAYIATVIATCIGYVISISIVLLYLKKNMDFNYRRTIELIKKLILPSLCMIVPIVIAKHFLPTFVYTRLNSFISLTIYGCVGVVIYLFVSYKNGSLENVFGEEFLNNLFRKLHLKK